MKPLALLLLALSIAGAGPQTRVDVVAAAHVTAPQGAPDIGSRTAGTLAHSAGPSPAFPGASLQMGPPSPVGGAPLADNISQSWTPKVCAGPTCVQADVKGANKQVAGISDGGGYFDGRSNQPTRVLNTLPVAAVVEPSAQPMSVRTGNSGGVGAEISGWATWYDDGPGLYAAIADYRGRPFLATVWHGRRHVRVLVRDFCACGFRDGIATVIDLSPEAFNVLSPAHPVGSDTDPGKLKVRVVIGGTLVPPATDTVDP